MAPPALEVSERYSRVLAEQAVPGQKENASRFTTQTGGQKFLPHFRAQLEELPSSVTEGHEDLSAVLTKIAGRYEQNLMQRHQKSPLSPGIVYKKRYDIREVPRECSALYTEDIGANSCDFASQNNPVMDTVRKPTAESGGDSSCKITSIVATRKEAKDSAKIDLFTMDDLTHSLSKLEDRKVNDEPYIQQQAGRDLQMSVKALNSVVMDFLISETRTYGLVIDGNHVDDSEMWKVGCSAEMLLEDLFVRNLKLIGDFKEPTPPSVIKASSQESAHVGIKNPAPLEKNVPSYNVNVLSSSLAMSPSPDEWSSVPQIENQSISPPSALQKQYPIENQHRRKQSKRVYWSTHKTIIVKPSDSTTKPQSSSSQSKSRSNHSSTRHKKGGRASNRGEGTLGERNGTDKVSSNVLPSGDHSNESQFENASSQTNEKGEACIQELHLSQELPNSSGSKIPPDKAVNKQRPRVSSSELPLTSSGGPGTETEPQTPPALLCIAVPGQPKAKPYQNTATILQDPPSAIHDEAANQLCSSFNIKPPPDAQVSHGAEISSGVLPEAEWNESATKSSASVNTFAVTLREHALDSEFPVAPAVQQSDEKPPSDESSHVQAVPEEINEDATSNKPVPVTKSPSSEGLVEAPALSTIDPETLLAVGQPAFDKHSLLGFLDGESVDEFSPLHFNSLAGDDGFVQLQPSSQEHAKEVVANDDGEVYQHPIEEAGRPKPDNTQMVISGLTLPANHMLENQPPPQAAASLCLLTYTTRGGRIVSALYDVWGFTALVDVDVHVPENTSNNLMDPVNNNEEGEREQNL